MAVTEVKGKKFIQVVLDSAGGDWVMSKPAVIRSVRVTGMYQTDYITFYEAAGNNPKIFRLDYDRSAVFFQGSSQTKIGFRWTDCNFISPSSVIISIEFGY